MCKERPAFGRRLEDLVELGAIEFRPEPLDAIIERRLKAIWAARSCPNCGEKSLQALDGSARIWCGRCDWKTTCTRGTPFYESELAPASSSSPSSSTLTRRSASTRSPSSSRRATRRFTIGSGSWKSRSSWVSRLSGSESPGQSLGRRRSMKHSRCVRASKGRSRRERGSTAAAHPKEDGHAGRESRVTN